MALFDAFSGFIRESVAGIIEETLTRMESRGSIMEAPRALQYARTVNDQMRVNVDNAPQTITYVANSSASLSAAVLQAWFAGSATFYVDEREQMRLQSEINFNSGPRQRWTFS